MGERHQQKKLVKMQHYKFLFYKNLFWIFVFLGKNEGQGKLWLLLNESSGLFSGGSAIACGSNLVWRTYLDLQTEASSFDPWVA